MLNPQAVLNAIQQNQSLLYGVGAGALVLALFSIYYAIRQINANLQQQPRWIREVFHFFRINSYLLPLVVAIGFFMFAIWIWRIAQSNPASSEDVAAGASPSADVAITQTLTKTETITATATSTATIEQTPKPIIAVLNLARTPLSPLTPVAPRVEPTITPTTQVSAKLMDGSMQVYTTTMATQPTPAPMPTATPTLTPNAPYIDFKDETQSVPLFAAPVDGLAPVTTLKAGPLIRQLSIDGQTADGLWYRVCCFVLPNQEDAALWFKNTSIVTNTDAVENIQPVVAPTPIQLTPFDRTWGPVCAPVGDLNFLTIIAKVYDNENRLLPGYLVKVQFQPTGQFNWLERRNTRVGPDGYSEVLSETTGSVDQLGEFNYKYEYRAPGATLGDGIWEFWLTNGEKAQLSQKESQFISSFNLCRKIYITWKLVR